MNVPALPWTLMVLSGVSGGGVTGELVGTLEVALVTGAAVLEATLGGGAEADPLPGKSGELTRR